MRKHSPKVLLIGLLFLLACVGETAVLPTPITVESTQPPTLIALETPTNLLQDLSMIEADSAQIQQLIMNLVNIYTLLSNP